MDKFKKVGLSALAGSLVAFSAQAIEWGVSGGAEITIVHNDSDEVTGNPIGARKNIGFSASGELDNGMGISVGHYMNDALTLGSSVYTFDMGSAGSVTLDYGAGGFGADEIDNVMPTAYEEADDGFATGISKIGANYSGHYLSYKNNFGGFTFGGSYNPSIGGGASGDGAAGGNDGGKGIDMFFRVSPIDGLEIGAGVGTIEDAGTTTGSDKEEDTMFVTYAVGPMKVGYQISNVDLDGGTQTESNIYGVTFNISDTMSVGYQKGVNKLQETGGAKFADTAVYEGFTAAYNMGSIAVKYKQNSADSVGGSKGSDDSTKELSLTFAF